MSYFLLTNLHMKLWDFVDPKRGRKEVALRSEVLILKGVLVSTEVDIKSLNRWL